MVMPGETVRATTHPCPDCKKTMTLEVLHASGYYLGFWCHNPDCPEPGPYSRETDYFATRAQAEEALRQPEEFWRGL